MSLGTNSGVSDVGILVHRHRHRCHVRMIYVWRRTHSFVTTGFRSKGRSGQPPERSPQHPPSSPVTKSTIDCFAGPSSQEGCAVLRSSCVSLASDRILELLHSRSERAE